MYSVCDGPFSLFLPLSLPPSSLPSFQVIVHPITRSSHSLLAHVKRREQDASGYPLMCPIGATLVHAIVETLYQLQEKEPWRKAIAQVSGEGEREEGRDKEKGRKKKGGGEAGALQISLPPFPQVLCSRLHEMDVLIHRLLDIRSALDGSKHKPPSASDDLLTSLSSLIGQLLQVGSSVCVCVCLSVCLSVHPFICPSIHPSIHLSIP